MSWKLIGEEGIKLVQYVAVGFLGGFSVSVSLAIQTGVVDLYTILAGGVAGGIYQAGKLILDIIQVPFAPKTTAGKGKKYKRISEYFL